MHKYRLVAKKGEGTFSEVLKAQCIKNSKYVAIKCMKNHFDSLDQVNNLREIQALRRLSPHPNIIKLLEVLYDQPTGRLALVFELMDMNVYELIRGRRHYVAEDRVKSYMYQLMKAMDHMHRNGIFHRDIKPENILIVDDVLKLADFGSCRGIYSKQPYTEYISTRWYRAPECLLTDGYYNYKMDMWGVGCVFFEIVSLFPLFPGTNELDQISKIHNVLGTPAPELLAKLKRRNQHIDFNFPPKEGTGIHKLIPHVSPDCVELISRLLCYNPEERLSARQALRHSYFRDLREQEKRQKALATPDTAGSSLFADAEKRAAANSPELNASCTPETSGIHRSESSTSAASSALPVISHSSSKGAAKELSSWHEAGADAGPSAMHSTDMSSHHLPGIPRQPVEEGCAASTDDLTAEGSSSQLPPISSLPQVGGAGRKALPGGAGASGLPRRAGQGGTYSGAYGASSYKQSNVSNVHARGVGAAGGGYGGRALGTTTSLAKMGGGHAMAGMLTMQPKAAPTSSMGPAGSSSSRHNKGSISSKGGSGKYISPYAQRLMHQQVQP